MRARGTAHQGGGRVARIVYASRRPFFPARLGGAARSGALLVAALDARGDTRCDALCGRRGATLAWDEAARAALGIREVAEEDGATRVRCDGLDVRFVPDADAALDARLRAGTVDAVWAMLDGAEALLGRALDAGVRAVLRVVDAEFDARAVGAIARRGAVLTANSPFIARRLLERTGVPATVTYAPFPRAAGDRVPRRDGLITMMNPVPCKGLETVVACIARLPRRRFQLVEVWPQRPRRWAALARRLAALPNVTLLRCRADVGPLYERTALLIVPSIWEEAFGRVAVEAHGYGIPVVASRRGGLPDTVGGGGLLVDDYEDPGAWVEAIERVLGDGALYARLSDAARRNARRPELGPEACARVLRAVCLDTPGVGAARR